MSNEIKHYNHNHSKDGRFTFGSSNSSKRVINYDTGKPIDKKLVKTASKKLKNTSKEYKGPLKSTRKKAAVKRNTKIKVARMNVGKIKKRYQEMQKASIDKKIEDAIINGDAQKISKYSNRMSDAQLNIAKNRLVTMQQIDEIAKRQKNEQKNFLQKLDPKKVDSWLNTGAKALTVYKKANDVKNELQIANTRIKDYKDTPISELDNYKPKHMKGIKHSKV